MKCINCKHGEISIDRSTYKMNRIYCKYLDKEIHIKLYNKIQFCLFHERKEEK